MKQLILSILILSSTLLGYTQSDKKAVAILDEVTAKTKAYKSIKIEFTYAMDNAKQKIHDKFNGALTSKGDKYNLSAAGQVVFCDGKTVWTYLKDAKEVQINDVNNNDDAFTPTKLLSNYTKDYKSKFISEKGNEQLLELYPLKKGKSMIKAQLTIDKAKKQVMKFVMFDKNGSTFSYIVNKFTTDQAISDNIFIFNKSDYPGVEINDMR